VNSQRWERLQELYAAAADLPLELRAGFLAGACGEDADLRREVEELLAADPPATFVTSPSPAAELFGYGLEDRRIGDFQLVREIGRGGMGVVYLAMQVSLGRRVAVKILPNVRRDARTLERFAREAKAASGLDHPHVVPVLASGEENGLAWFAMAYVDGHDLAEDLRQQREGGETILPRYGTDGYVRAVATLCADLADAVQAAHDAGIVHRDIKPSNVLLDRRGAARLSDFGIARSERLGTLTTTDAVQGTPYYMSPEQARALDARVDHRTDVYSLSVVLYEMLTLRRAFDGSTSQEVLAKIASEAPPALRRCNPAVARDLAVICEKGMSKRPAQRYGTARELADDLRRFLAFQAIHAKPPSLAQRAADRLRRNARPLAVAAGMAVALLAGLGWSDRRSVHAAVDADRIEFAALLDAERWDGLTDRLVSARRRLLQLEEDGMPVALRDSAKELKKRFAGDREERLALCLAARAVGIGARSGVDGYGAHLSAPSPEDLLRALADAREASLLYWDDPELAELADVRSIYPRVAVRLDDEAASVHGTGAGRVSVRRVDLLTGLPGDAVPLGATPLEPFALSPGYYRVAVEIDGIGHCELTRYLQLAPTPLELVAHVRRFDEVAADMVPIPAGEVVHRPDSIGCRPEGSASAHAGFRLDAAEVSNGEIVAFLEATGGASPRLWSKLGYATSWREMPVDGVGDRWLRLPAVGLSWFEAQAYAEWAGKRLPSHVELERGQRGGEQVFTPSESTPPDAAGRANVSGPVGGAGGTWEAMYRVYLENALPVDDPAYRQAPSGIYHAYGNVAEYTETMATKVRGGMLVADPWSRLALGGAWDAQARGQSLAAHALTEIGSDFLDTRTGFRCALSDEP
jgi:formylglycine-generating enzyme required for sulfatase activity